ncbi:unnamed protein product [Lampetra planeri]
MRAPGGFLGTARSACVGCGNDGKSGQPHRRHTGGAARSVALTLVQGVKRRVQQSPESHYTQIHTRGTLKLPLLRSNSLAHYGAETGNPEPPIKPNQSTLRERAPPSAAA